jgi:hypothetical protein
LTLEGRKEYKIEKKEQDLNKIGPRTQLTTPNIRIASRCEKKCNPNIRIASRCL